MTHNIEVESGKTVKLPTAGKYCDRDVLVTGFGSDAAELKEKYDEGVAAGEANGAAICAAKHFTYNFVGDGGDSVTVHVPFIPDVLELLGYDPCVMDVAGALASFTYDRGALGTLVGFVHYGNGAGGLGNVALAASAIPGRCTIDDDGTVHFFNLGGSRATVTFPVGFRYTLVAVKYAEQTDKERITEFVNRLTGSGSVTLQQAKVTAAFTDEEWASLIATKPGWTFNWI